MQPKNIYCAIRRRYLKTQKRPPKYADFDQFWEALQRVQSKQTLNSVTKLSTKYRRQFYSIPTTLLDYLIQSCHSKLLLDISKSCRELSYMCEKLRGKAVGHLILGELKTDIGITTSIVESDSPQKNLLFISNFETPFYLKNIVSEDVLEIQCPPNDDQNIIQIQQKIFVSLNHLKKIWHKKLIFISSKSNLKGCFMDSILLLLFHINLTEVDMINSEIPLKYLPQLKSCTKLRITVDFKVPNEEIDNILRSWKLNSKFKKFVIKTNTALYLPSFIDFITKSMTDNSIFAIYAADATNNFLLTSDEKNILHLQFCNGFGNLPRNCYLLQPFLTEQQNISSSYQIAFGSLQLISDIFDAKNISISKKYIWTACCSYSVLM